MVFPARVELLHTLYDNMPFATTHQTTPMLPLCVAARWCARLRGRCGLARVGNTACAYANLRCCPNSIFKCAASFHLCPSPYAWNISTTRSQPSLCVTLSFHWGQFASGAIILDQFNCRILVTRVNITTSNNYTTLKRENYTGDKYLLF